MSSQGASRIAKTKAKIFRAAEELMDEKTPTITVSDVLERAGVSRGSFYAHFTGLEDLAVTMFRDRFSELGREAVLRRLLAGTSAAEASYQAIRDVVEQVVTHRALYLGVETLGGRRHAHETLVDLLYEQVLASARAIPNRPSEVVAEDVARFIAAGTMALIVEWMRTGDELDIETMTRRLNVLMPTWGNGI